MRLVKWGALAGALVIVEALAPPAHGQSARVSIAQAPRAARVLQLMGRGTQIGVTVRDPAADDASKATSGVVIEEVAKDSPAEKAGLKAGDMIVEFDGEHVRSVRQFSRLVQETPDGRKVQAVVMRGGQRTTVSVTPERGDGFMSGDTFDWRPFEGKEFNFDMPPAPPEPPRPPRAPRAPLAPSLPDFSFRIFGGGRFGVGVEELTPQLRDYFGVKEGVLVKSVTEGSAAAKAGLKAGDVITAIDGTHVEDTSDVVRAIDRMSEDAEFTVEVVRDRKTQTLKGKLERRRDVNRTRTIV